MAATTDAADRTFDIPAANLWTLDARIAKLNKRAAKLGVEGVGYTVIARYCPRPTEGNPARRETAEVAVTGESIRFEGWTFVGTIEHIETGNILRAAPGETFPESYRNAPRACEHCHSKRQRTDTFVVRDEAGEHLQVGRNCTADFLGHIDPKRLAAWLTFLADLGADEDGDERSARGKEAPIPTDEFVAHALAAVRLDGGFRPVSFHGESTVSTVDLALSGHGKAYRALVARGFKVNAADYAEAARLIEWVATDAAGSSDYVRNLRAAAAQPSCTSRHWGLLASLPKAAQGAATRADEKQQRMDARAERAAAKTPAPTGKVEVEGTIEKFSAHETDYGVTDKMTVACDGFKVWVTNPTSLGTQFHYDDEGKYVEDAPAAAIGDRVRFTATLTRSDRDPSFAFAKRPSKAAIVERASATVS